jgi:putative oxidoreductase
VRDPQAWGKALLRITLGVIFVLHGYRALHGGARGMADLIARIGFPAEFAATLAWYLIVVHLAGGALMVIGYWTRLAAALQLPVMVSAVALVHWKQGIDRMEFPVLVLVATLAIALMGPGTLAVDKAAGAGARRRGA